MTRTCEISPSRKPNPRASPPRLNQRRPRQAVLERPGDPQPRDRLAAPATRRRHGVEAAPGHQNRARPRPGPRHRHTDGHAVVPDPRSAPFYLDIGQWALDDPARWGPWAVPCPVRPATRSAPPSEDSCANPGMDQRTRERLPVLPALVAKSCTEPRSMPPRRLPPQAVTVPGAVFTSGTVTPSLPATHRLFPAPPDLRPKTRYRTPGVTPSEKKMQAFWAWAAIEVLRAHRHPRRGTDRTVPPTASSSTVCLATGELIPLLHITPSKTDVERLLVISPELADTLAAIIHRVRDDSGAVPLVIRLRHPRMFQFNPAMPLLFQRHVGTDNLPISAATIRPPWITGVLDGASLTDAHRRGRSDSRPTTSAGCSPPRLIMNGLPPHICQLIMGHKNINTTMGYKAVYPEEVINGHRAFITRSRELRPPAEYRTPTDSEWEEFLGHFERRKARARRLRQGLRHRLHPRAQLHPLPAPPRPPQPQQARLTGIRDNLIALGSAKPSKKAGPERPKGSRSASPPPSTSWPRSRRPPATAKQSASACPHSATSPPAPLRRKYKIIFSSENCARSTVALDCSLARLARSPRTSFAVNSRKTARADLFGDWLEHIPVLGDRGLGPDGVGGRRLDAARDVLVQAAVFLADLGFGPTADRPTSALAVGGSSRGRLRLPNSR